MRAGEGELDPREFVFNWHGRYGSVVLSVPIGGDFWKNTSLELKINPNNPPKECHIKDDPEVWKISLNGLTAAIIDRLSLD